MKKLIMIVIYAVAAFFAWRLFQLYQKTRPEKSLRADKPAPSIPSSSAILAGRPQVDAAFNLPTTNAGSAPLWKWDFDTVANIFQNN